MERIKDYQILKKLSETRGSVAYRGQRQGEDTVIIQVLKAGHVSSAEVARFKREYDIIKTLPLDGVVKTLDVIDYQGRFALVLEDFGGISIKMSLKQKRFDTPSFLEIAIALSSTLGHLHHKGIIHRAVKPDHILRHPRTGELKITGFGISATITHENDQLYNIDVIKDTLVYISPEQTGRMNRPVDYRTDLYSPGITFYEMLTGKAPFLSQDPLEVIHSHIAMEPIPPIDINPDIPAPVSDIILRLLLKTAEERYQNAFGLMAELKECNKRYRENGSIGPFALAQRDISNRFIIPQNLYGREQEHGALLRTFERVCGDTCQIMLVAGRPGIGKSALVNEIHKPIVAKQGYFIRGKYEQLRKDVPYSAIIQAFQALVRHLLAESEERIKAWRNHLLAALGPNGRVITDIIPEVALIIGKQPRLPKLDAEASKNRFNLVFERFVGVFPKMDHPVALFLDDLQWVWTVQACS